MKERHGSALRRPSNAPKERGMFRQRPAGLGKRGMFWPFRLLIAVLMSFTILIIIFSALSYFEGLKVQVSMERLEKGFDSAWGAITTPDKPDKGITREKNLTIPAGTISSEWFAIKYNLNYECIELQVPGNSPFELSANGYAVKVKSEAVTTVYFLCIYDKDDALCKERCYVSFGLEPEIP